MESRCVREDVSVFFVCIKSARKMRKMRKYCPFLVFVLVVYLHQKFNPLTKQTRITYDRIIRDSNNKEMVSKSTSP